LSGASVETGRSLRSGIEQAATSRAPRPVFIVGCPRSGTSPFSRWLHACGLTTVADERKNERYPAGYFEHLPMLMFHRALERLPRGAEHRITTEPYLTEETLQHPYVAQSFELAFEPVLQEAVDFIKYPQLALSIDFLLDRFRSAHVVGLWRNPRDTFRSLVTKEFPLEMLAGAPLKAVLLWSVYAHHLCAAKRKHPERVTLVEIDGFIADPAAGPALLERIGRPRASAVPVREAIDPALWRRRTPLRWRAAHALVAALSRGLAGRLGSQRAALADQARWLSELREKTDFGRPTDGAG
jgi:hypothetical protein